MFKNAVLPRDLTSQQHPATDMRFFHAEASRRARRSSEIVAQSRVTMHARPEHDYVDDSCIFDADAAGKDICHTRRRTQYERFLQFQGGLVLLRGLEIFLPKSIARVLATRFPYPTTPAGKLKFGPLVATISRHHWFNMIQLCSTVAVFRKDKSWLILPRIICISDSYNKETRLRHRPEKIMIGCSLAWQCKGKPIHCGFHPPTLDPFWLVLNCRKTMQNPIWITLMNMG